MKARFASIPISSCCLVTALTIAISTAPAPGAASDSSPSGEWKPLFNGKNLDGWYVVIRERRSDDPAESNKTLDDPNHLVQVQDGAVHMYRDAPAGSQQPFGYISTKEEYSEYDLRLEYKWGVKRFAPRSDAPRDAGLLYHVVGIDRVWPQSVECQIWERDVGDTYAVYTRVTAPVDPARIKDPVYLAAEAGGVSHMVGRHTEIGRVGRNPKSEQEGWNTIEVRVRGDSATHIINGVTNNVVLKMERWLDNAWVPLRKGRIALQLEGAEVLYRNIQIREVRAAADEAASKASRAHSPAEGLVANWTFDETGGVQLKDSSGRDYHGVLRGATRAAGKSGGAVECGTDALVEVPHAAGFDDFKNGITVSAWVNRTADTNWNTVISRQIKAGWSEYFGLAVAKNKALFSVDGDGAHYQNIKSDEDVPVGEWVHLTGTYDNKEFRLYVNGRLIKSAPYTVPFRFADTNPLLIGGNSNSQGKSWVDCFHGRIDEVRLHARALAASEVAGLASAEAHPVVPAADLVKAKSGSGVYGYKDTPKLPWCEWLVHDPDRPAPPKVAPGPAGPPAPVPADALVLFDGKDTSQWTDSTWAVRDGLFVAEGGQSPRTRREFGSFQLHVEWKGPANFEGPWINRGNNGIVLHNLYEIQIFDSFNEPIYPDGQCAAIYGQTPPLVNVTRRPGEWQSYDIVFRAPQFAAGRMTEPPRVTVFHNGVLVHDNQVIHGAIGHRVLPDPTKAVAKGPIRLGGHGCPVAFRNLWIRPLAD